MKIRDYADLMYHDTATRRMLERHGDLEVSEATTMKLMELDTYFRVPISENPLAEEVCRRHRGKRFKGPVTMELYRSCCAGYGVKVY